jgi:hypothetical protein
MDDGIALAAGATPQWIIFFILGYPRLPLAA